MPLTENSIFSTNLKRHFSNPMLALGFKNFREGFLNEIMKAYKRADFIKLPAMTIYSRINEQYGELMYGLFCKTSGEEYTVGVLEF